MKRILFAITMAVVCTAFCIAQSGASFYRQEGIASWYGTEFDGRPTASGEIFNSRDFTAAHPTLPFGTVLTVTNRHNNKSVQVRVNDRGPFVAARIIDVSQAAAAALDMISTGTAPVIVEGYTAEAPVPAPVPGYAITITPGPAQAAPQPTEAFPPAAQTAIPQGAFGSMEGQGYPPPQVQPAPAYAAPAPSAPVYAPQPVQPAPAYVPQTPPQYAAPQQPAPVYTVPAPAYAPQPAAPQYAAPQPSQPQYMPAPQPAYAPPAPPAVLNPPMQLIAGKHYRLQVGSYKVARNAVDTFDRLKAVGLNPAYERNGDWYRVVLAGVAAQDVGYAAARIGAAGFPEAIIKQED